jgi:hypothetical protein
MTDADRTINQGLASKAMGKLTSFCRAVTILFSLLCSAQGAEAEEISGLALDESGGVVSEATVC